MQTEGPAMGGLIEGIWRDEELSLETGRSGEFLRANSRFRDQITPRAQLAAFPDVKPALEALKRHGPGLQCLSNDEPKILEAAAKSAGIRDLLDEIISVEDAKIFKPSPRVYNLAQLN